MSHLIYCAILNSRLLETLPTSLPGRFLETLYKCITVWKASAAENVDTEGGYNYETEETCSTFTGGSYGGRHTGRVFFQTIRALNTETMTATPKESSTAAPVITTGISIPCDSVLPIPRRINFRTTHAFQWNKASPVSSGNEQGSAGWV